MENFKELTVDQLRSEVEELKRLQEITNQAEEVFDQAKAKVDAKKMQILDCLERNGLENFKVPGVGQVYTRTEFFVKQPQSAEAEAEFNSWLQTNGYDHLRKVNTNTLKSFYREQLEVAAEKGEIVFIPGLELPTTRKTLTMRKG